MKPGTRGARGRPLSPASINRQIEFLRHMMNWAVGRDTGMRRGEMLALRFADLDLDRLLMP